MHEDEYSEIVATLVWLCVKQPYPTLAQMASVAKPLIGRANKHRIQRESR